MAKPVFVDTSAWYAVADASDRHHGEAERCLQRLVRDRQVLLTTNLVIGETYTLLRVRLGYFAAHTFLDRVRHGNAVRRIFVSESWEEATEDLLRHFRDQDFSYVDATSFVAMRRIDVQEAFTYDNHFGAAGFTLLGFGE